MPVLLGDSPPGTILIDYAPHTVVASVEQVHSKLPLGKPIMEWISAATETIRLLAHIVAPERRPAAFASLRLSTAPEREGFALPRAGRV